MSSSICGSCAAHSGWIVALAPRASNRGTSTRGDHLQMGDVVAAAASDRCASSAASIASSALAHRAVAERVEVHLEAGRVQRGHVLAQRDRVDEAQPLVAGRAAAAVEVACRAARR